MESIPGNEGRIAQAWVNVRGRIANVFSAYFWHSEGWTLRNEALAGSSSEASKNKTDTRGWIACDANMCPEDFEKSLWFQREMMHVVTLKGVSTCRSKGPTRCKDGKNV